MSVTTEGSSKIWSKSTARSAVTQDDDCKNLQV